MVRATYIGMVYDGKQYAEIACLSTDEKPIDNYLTGSTLIEIDTSDVYFFDEDSASWIKAGGDDA